MKPFSLYLHRLKVDLGVKEYPHMFIVGNESKKLPLYPQILIKCKDIGVEKNKTKF